MKTRRHNATNARKKQLKIQNTKMNARRQFFFNQLAAEQASSQSKEA